MREIFLIIISVAFYSFSAGPDKTEYKSPVGNFKLKFSPGNPEGGIFSSKPKKPEYRFYGANGLISEGYLVNSVSPVMALLPPGGAFFVTFDEWGNMGGPHAVTIYKRNGDLIRDFHMRELFHPEELEKYFKKTPAGWLWGPERKTDFRENGKFLDISTGFLTLTINTSDGTLERQASSRKEGLDISLSIEKTETGKKISYSVLNAADSSIDIYCKNGNYRNYPLNLFSGIFYHFHVIPEGGADPFELCRQKGSGISYPHPGDNLRLVPGEKITEKIFLDSLSVKKNGLCTDNKIPPGKYKIYMGYFYRFSNDITRKYSFWPGIAISDTVEMVITKP